MLRRQLSGFLVVGAGGFAVDAGLLQSLVSFADVHPHPARAVSFTAAVVFTWWLNRSWSFAVKEAPSWGEFFLYLKSMALGGVINWVTYAALVERVGLLGRYPALALLPATLLAMAFNFSTMRFWIFRRG